MSGISFMEGLKSLGLYWLVVSLALVVDHKPLGSIWQLLWSHVGIFILVSMCCEEIQLTAIVNCNKRVLIVGENRH